MVSGDNVKDRIEEILAETDPERRLALSRRLRAEIWDLLGDDALEKLAESGMDIEKLRHLLRLID